MLIEMRKVSDIKPYKRNPRDNERGTDAVARSIQQFGFRQPIVLDKNGVIIVGHVRWNAVKKLGWEKVPVHVADMTPEQARAYRIADNKTNELSDWNLDLLVSELDALRKDTDIDFTQLGFELDELQKLLNPPGTVGLTGPDEMPEVKKPVAQTGDLWLLGKHRLLCGDATKSQDMATLMDGQKADLLLTDPPYGIGIVKGRVGGNTGRIGSSQPQPVMCGSVVGAKHFGRVRQPGGRASGVLRGHVGGKGLVKPGVYPVITGDDKPFDPKHLLALADTAIIFGANHFAQMLPPSACWLVWDKNVAPESTFSKAELAWVSKGNHVLLYRYTWSGLVREGKRDIELVKRVHPTQKPVGLFSHILKDFKGDAILDPYMGSGTTIIAAEQTGRKCYGMEIEPHYCDVIVKRWEDFTGKKAELERRRK